MRTTGKSLKRIHITLVAALAAALLASGCGGGGGASRAAAGHGRVAASVKFSGRAAQRAAEQTSGKITVDVAITGVYSVDKKQFAPLTTRVELDPVDGYARGTIMEVPIGVNHVLTAIATYTDGSHETVKCIIPKVSDGVDVTVTADARSTVIADAAAALAERDGKTLPDVTAEEIETLAAAVDAMVAQGTAYADMTAEEVLDFNFSGQTPATIELTPNSTSLYIGQTTTFAALVKNSSGSALSDTVTWTVEGGIGTITTEGVFTATTAGSGSMVATAGSISAAAPVTVLAEQLVSITVTPSSASVPSGGTQQFMATGYTQGGAAVTITPVWTVSGAGTIDAFGVFTATTAGGAMVSATVGAVSGQAAVTVTAGALSSMTISPASATVVSGATQQFTASGTDGNGNTATVTPTWSVTGGVGTIDTNGVFTATAAGSGTVTAVSGGVTASAQVTVTAGAATSIAVTPDPATVVSGSTLQFQATGYDAAGNAVTVTATWAVSGGVGTINSSGLFTGVTAGSGTVTATAGGLTDTAAVTVISGTVLSVTISPSSATVVSGATQQFTATVTDGNGNTISVTPSWSVSGGVGSINGSGLFSGVTAGGGTVTATAGGVSGTANVTVTAGAVTTVTVTPATETVTLGSTRQFTATALDANGNTVSTTVAARQVAAGGPASSFVWSTSGLIGSVDSSGLFTASKEGTDTVTATAGGVSGSASVTVPNSAPVANAGVDQSADTGVTVTLNGAGSADADVDDTLTYVWTQVSGPAVSLSNNNVANPTFVPVSAGAYVFSLTVSDSTESSSDSVTVTVASSPVPAVSDVSPRHGANTANQTITVSGTNFMSGAAVDIGATAAVNVTVVSQTMLTAEVPSGMTAGAYIVTVTNPDTQAATLIDGYFVTSGAGTSHSGTITANQTWTLAGSPHLVTGSVTIASTCSGPTVTIEAGAVVVFSPGTILNVGTSNCGALAAEGAAGAILFTSGAATPAAGDWDGIVFGPNTQANATLNKVIVEYAGYAVGAGLFFNGTTQPQVTNSVIRNTIGLGVKFADNSYPAAFTANKITGSTGWPLEIYGEFVRTLPGGGTYTGNGTDKIKVMGDTLTTSGTWANHNVPYAIQGDIIVANTCSGPTLTIAAGNELYFAAGMGLDVGVANCGTLVADGAGGAIKFSSLSATPAAGDWKGITIGVNGQTGTLLNYVIVEYGGNTTGAGLTINNNVSTISNSQIRLNGGIGVLFLSGGGGENAFTGNVISGNAARPLDVYANYLSTIPAGNTLTGNGDDAIDVQSGTAAIAGTWANNGVPMRLAGAVTMTASITIAAGAEVRALGGDISVANTCSGPTLTVGAGALLKFGGGYGLNIGVTNCGKLIADGAGGQITFTSASATPAAGDWMGVTFGANTQSGTLLNNVAVEYAGHTTVAGLTFNSSTPQVTNSVISDTNGDGVKFADGEYPAAFTANTITANTGYPISIYGEFARTLPGGGSYTGNGKDAIKVAGDILTTSGTWANHGVPYEIQGDINVYSTCAGPTLTIAPGNELRFLAGTGLNVGVTNCGALAADGSTSQIKFTSGLPTPAAGDWKGITIGTNGQTGTLLDNVVIEYAGNTTGAGLTINNNVSTISNSRVRLSQGVGVLFQSGGGGENAFTGNIITGNTQHPVDVYANYLATIPAGNTLTGNGQDVIMVQPGTANIAGTWANNGVPMKLTGTVTMQASIAVAAGATVESVGDINVYNTCSGPTLTVNTGATMKFGMGMGLYIGVTNCGTLIANGATFTSGMGTPGVGDWKGITFGSNTQAATLLNDSVVEYAGHTTGAGLTFNSSAPQITGSDIRYTTGVGAKFADGMSPAAFTTNTITGNTTYPIEIYGEFARALPGGGTYTGNGVDAIKVMGDIISTSGTWANHGVPYEIQGDISVYNTCSGPALTIATGSTLKFLSGAGLIVGVTNCGRLIANGTAGAGVITFTSASNTPAAGDWDGITFGSNIQNGTIIDNGVIEYGGTNTFGNVYMTNTATKATVTNSTVRYGGAWGIYVGAGSTYSAGDESTCVFAGNTSGNVFR